MNYLEQYQRFLNTPKVFTVKFYEEYEGEGGYWDYRDNWIHGDYVQKLYSEKSFTSLEKALKFADKIQEEIAEIEQKRCTIKNHKIEWYSKYQFYNENLLTASINWGGSNFKMKITYKFIEE